VHPLLRRSPDVCGSLLQSNPDVLLAAYELLYTCMISHMDKLPEEVVLESTKTLLVGVRTSVRTALLWCGGVLLC
jgi:hypothetical protein